jgi:predicted lipoprotein with Yx(FWY)xxD motif
MRPRLLLIALPLGVAALALLAGCGGDGSSPSYGGSASTGSTSASTGGGAATVAVANNPELGEILVDGDGRTLYLFEKDESNESYCNGQCAKVWPPYTTKGDPKASEGAKAASLGTLKRDDGSTQVTYNGAPLYRYADDTQAGQANGNELDQFGAEWYALHPSGEKAEGSEGGGSAGGGQGGGGTAEGGGNGGSAGGGGGGGYGY